VWNTNRSGTTLGCGREMAPSVRFALALVVSFVAVAYAQVQCTVGSSGTYSTINAGLSGCNGGVGSYELIIDGQFSETLFFPLTAVNVTLTSLEFTGGLVPASPFPENITARISGFDWIVANVSTAIFIRGIVLDGLRTTAGLFKPWLINNNITLDRCLVSNWTGEYVIRIEACRRSVLGHVVNTRFQDIWGNAFWAQGMEDIIVEGNVLDRVGGFMNQSGMYLKPSYVTEGTFVLRNNSGWLLVDAQPRNCIFLGDVNGVTRCNRGALGTRLLVQ